MRQSKDLRYFQQPHLLQRRLYQQRNLAIITRQLTFGMNFPIIIQPSKVSKMSLTRLETYAFCQSSFSYCRRGLSNSSVHCLTTCCVYNFYEKTYKTWNQLRISLETAPVCHYLLRASCNVSEALIDLKEKRPHEDCMQRKIRCIYVDIWFTTADKSIFAFCRFEPIVVHLNIRNRCQSDWLYLGTGPFAQVHAGCPHCTACKRSQSSNHEYVKTTKEVNLAWLTKSLKMVYDFHTGWHILQNPARLRSF